MSRFEKIEVHHGGGNRSFGTGRKSAIFFVVIQLVVVACAPKMCGGGVCLPSRKCLQQTIKFNAVVFVPLLTIKVSMTNYSFIGISYHVSI